MVFGRNHRRAVDAEKAGAVGSPTGTQAEMNEKTPHRPIYLTTRSLTSHVFFGAHIWIPMVAAFVWLAVLLALIGLWVKDGKPQYMPDEGSVIVYISDVAATYKKFFIIMVCIVSGFYISAMVTERWLRLIDRLPSDIRRREQVYDWLAIFFACVGSAGLILLSIMDAFNHSTVHWIGTLIFVVGVALSAIFQTMEILALKADHPDRNHLRRNAFAKLFIVGLAIIGAIIFGVTFALSNRSSKGCDAVPLNAYCDRMTNISGGAEWSVAFILFFYFLTLVADLWPAAKSSPRYMRRLARWQEKHQPHAEHDFYGRPAFNEGNTAAWQGQDGHALHPNAPVTQGAYGNANQTAYGNTQQGAYDHAGNGVNLAQPVYPNSGYAAEPRHSGVESYAPRTSTAQNSEAGLIRNA